jgi:hypothetical protein
VFDDVELARARVPAADRQVVHGRHRRCG